MIERILIVDVETTGVHDSDACIEVGAILFDVPWLTCDMSFSSLLPRNDNAAEPFNHIRPEALARAPDLTDLAWATVRRMAAEAQAFVAFNAAFDRRFFPRDIADSIPWICAMKRIAWPVRHARRNLTELVRAHGLDVDERHRALPDCDLLARLFRHLGEGLQIDVCELLAEALPAAA